jgi:uroporphyrinogen III methyltransferase/synthase
MPNIGKVYLVGAGPGDPGLLTLRGRDCLACAEVVVYDGLANPALLEHAPNAERVYVGKRTDQHSLPQEEIIRVLISEAEAGRCVVRLKGGDPFLFGRGGEECEGLAAADIPFEVVPGVTAGIGAPAYAGIPVTHRNISSSVTFFTGHGIKGREEDALDFGRLALDGTLVSFMGIANLQAITEELVRIGRAPETPVAVVEWGTYARQRTITGTLSSIVQESGEANIEAPALVVIGEVVSLRETISWFEARPLHGLRVAVTHTTERRGGLETRLRELGADVFSFPTLEIAPPEERGGEEADAEVFANISDFDWIVMTSVNAATMLFAGLERAGLDARALSGVRLCAVGGVTTHAIEERFLKLDAAPKRFGVDAVLGALREVGDLEGASILLPRADIARQSLPDALREARARVSELVAYKTKAPQDAEARVEELLNYEPHVVAFTNSSAARHFAGLLGQDALETLLADAAVACIGPVTAQAARGHGMTVAIEPAEHDILHLIEGICRWRTEA